jgi:hypothetical protein
MPARDSDDDIHKYMPDFKTILRTADPTVAAEKRRAALDAPDVVEVIAELREDNEVTLPVGIVSRATAAASASPWAAAEGEINKAALPSSLAPNAAPPVVRDAADAKPKRAETAKKKFPAWAASVAAVVAVAGPVTFAVILLSRPTQNGAATAPSATGLAVVGSAAASVVTSAAPLATQAPSVQSAAPVPSVSAVAPPAAVPTPPEPARPKLGRHDGDPYDAALPKPAKTVEPAAQPVPTQQPTAVPAPGKSPVEGDRVFGN